MSDTTPTKAPAGWKVDKDRPGWERYWTGTAWTEERRETSEPMGFGEGPGGLLLFGIVIAIIGGVFGGYMIGQDDGDIAGIIILSVLGGAGSIFITVATVALGVDLGIRTARRKR